MSSITTTWDLASNQIANYIQPLETGGNALPFESRDQSGHMVNLKDDYLSGGHLLLVFLNRLDTRSFSDTLKVIAEKQDQFDNSHTKILLVTASSDTQDNRKLSQQLQLFFPILNDSTGVIFASYGLHKCHGPEFRMVLLTPSRQIRRWTDGRDNIKTKLDDNMNTIATDSISQSSPWSVPHAPILLVPNVLSEQECKTLVSTFHPDVPMFVRPPKEAEHSGDYKIPVYEHNRQDRVDQIIKNKNNLAFLDERIWGRVTPAIKKAFAFDVSRREDLHIARYNGERSGNHMGHRDNTATASYRRFAFSMNLNDDYEGGELKFKEFSNRGYRAAPGTAMVFSSSLLHEVMETTKGTRYNLITHFFNEDSLREFQKK